MHLGEAVEVILSHLAHICRAQLLLFTLLTAVALSFRRSDWQSRLQRWLYMQSLSLGKRRSRCWKRKKLLLDLKTLSRPAARVPTPSTQTLDATCPPMRAPVLHMKAQSPPVRAPQPSAGAPPAPGRAPQLPSQPVSNFTTAGRLN